MATMFVNGSKRNEQFLQRTFHRCFLPRFGSFGQAVSEQKIFRNRPIRNKNCPWRPCLLMDRDEMSNLYQRTIHRCFLTSFGSFGQAVSEKIFKNRPNGNKNCLWRPCLLTDRDKISNLTEDLPQILHTKFRFIWPSGFREDFQKSAIQKLELPVVAMFVDGSGQNEQSLERTFLPTMFHFIWLRGFRGED